MSKDKPTRINLNADYFITDDGVNITAYKANGEKRAKVIGYYGNIVKALEAIIKHQRLSISDCETFEDYIEQIKKSDTDMLEQVRQIVL